MTKRTDDIPSPQAGENLKRLARQAEQAWKQLQSTKRQKRQLNAAETDKAAKGKPRKLPTTMADKFRAWKTRQAFGKLGPASAVRRIDPASVTVIDGEVVDR